MRTIKFQTDELVPSLALVSSVVLPKNSLPILNDVRLETINDGNGGVCLMLMASDSETWLQVKTPISDSEEGILLCIESKAFLQALRNLSGKLVVMTIDDDKHLVTCEYNNGHFSLPFENASEFPLPASAPEDATTKIIDSSRLLAAIEKAGFATANDELRPVMNGVHFDFLESGMVAVATDGHKLAKYTDLTIQKKDDESITGFTLPKKPAHTLLNVLSGVTGDVKLMCNDRFVSVNNTQFRLFTRLIEGRYPNYDSVIPKDNDKIAHLNKPDVVAALKRVLPMSNTSSELVAITLVGDGTVIVSAEDIDFSKKGSETLFTDYSGEKFTMGFKGSTLLQLLQNINGDNVCLQLKEPSRAGVITEGTSNESGYDYLSLIMPMLIE